MPLLLDIDPCRSHAADTSVVGDPARLHGFEQDGELADMIRVLRLDALQRRFVLERLQVGRRIDDRGAQAQHIESVTIRTRLVADLDNTAVGIAGRVRLATALLPGLEVLRCVDERIEGLGSDFELLPGLDFAEMIHSLGFP